MATQLKPWLAAAVWILGAILSLCGAITYAELARAHPEAGGLYVFIREGHGRTAAFVFGWMSLLVNISGTVATLVAAAGGILHETFLGQIPANWIAVGLAIALGLVNPKTAVENSHRHHLRYCSQNTGHRAAGIFGHLCTLNGSYQPEILQVRRLGVY